MPLYEKPVRLLMRDMVAALGVQPGQALNRQRVYQWFRENYPMVKSGTIGPHLIRLTTNDPTRLHYSARADGSDDLFVRTAPGMYRLYENGSDPAPIRARQSASDDGTPEVDEEGESDAESPVLGSSEFAFEADLRDYLAANLHLLEPALRPYEDDGVTGVEFPVGGRRADILAVDRDGGYVVIELKVSRGYDRAVGQVLRYMGWVRRELADPGQSVRGMIVCKTISEDLKLACEGIEGVSLFEYKLSVSIGKASVLPPRGKKIQSSDRG